MRLESCVRDLLKRGVGDWIQAAEVASVAKSIGGASTDTEIRALAVALVRKVLEDGLMAIGDLRRDGFQSWNVPVREAVSRVDRDWTALGRSPNIGDLFWLSNTEEGDRRAQQLSAGESS